MTFSSELKAVHGPAALAASARSSGVVRAAVPLTSAGVARDGLRLLNLAVELKNLLATNAILSYIAHAQSTWHFDLNF